jgi:fucose permease
MDNQQIARETSPLLNDLVSTCSCRDANLTCFCTRIDYSLVFRISAAMYSFATIGLFNSSIGAILPLLSSHYILTDLDVSVVFLVGPLGYIAGAQFSSAIHRQFGQRGIAFFGSVLQAISAGILCLHLPFGIALLGFTVQGLCTGLLDGSWCAWAGHMKKANTVSGLLHGSYSIGAAAGPLLVAYLTAKSWEWSDWYQVLVSANFNCLTTDWLIVESVRQYFQHSTSLFYVRPFEKRMRQSIV